MKKVFSAFYTLTTLILIFSPLLSFAGDPGILSNVSATVNAFTTTANVQITYDYHATGGPGTLEGFKIQYGSNPESYTIENTAIKTLFFPEEDALAQTAFVTLTGLSSGFTYYFDITDTTGATMFLEKQSFTMGTVTDAEDSQSGSSSPSCDTDTSYCLLAPLPIGGDKSLVNKFYFTSTDTALPADEKATNFGSYINGLFTFAIGMAGALAVVLIVIGGIQYMSTDNFAEKAEGRGRIISALSGLILLIGAYMILNTINPNLVNFKFKISEVSVEASDIIGIDAESPDIEDWTATSLPTTPGINCPQSGGNSMAYEVAQSFFGRVTYNQELRGTTGPTTAAGVQTLYNDCSGFVNAVRQCVGDTVKIGQRTADMFNPENKNITSLTGTQVNGIDLLEGDILGWEADDTGGWTTSETCYKVGGHVVMYAGEGKIVEVNGPTYNPSNPSPGLIGADAIQRDLATYPYKECLLHWIRAN